MADNTYGSFYPAEGCEREDIKEEACDNAYGYAKGGQPNIGNPKPFGADGPGDLQEPQLGKGERNSWGAQGFMVQPLKNGFGIIGTRTQSRRDEWELSEGDNWDPIQGLGPRLKKHKDAGD